MVLADYRGARGSNAGDEYHVLWTLHKALSLLDPRSELISIYVEGVAENDAEGKPLDLWEGVDSAFYYGEQNSTDVKRIELVQFKYSGANPDAPWTISGLSRKASKSTGSSTVARLAQSFITMARSRPDLLRTGNLVARLISNRPVSADVFEALAPAIEPGSPIEKKKEELRLASGLDPEEFQKFSANLDLSECGRDSRFEIGRKILATISEWNEVDSESNMNALIRHIETAMLPEAKDRVITKQSILATLGISDQRALFPCPADIKNISKLVSRKKAAEISKAFISGVQRICLHGEGGLGKTTLIQEIASSMPPESLTLVFDCFGKGRYLDSEAYRHRPKDAYLQLANELSVRSGSPLLLTRRDGADYDREFHRRLEKGSKLVAARSPEALLLVVVDAADNSVMASRQVAPPDPSFVHSFVKYGQIPSNVRFLVTCRTGRRDLLNIPKHSYIEHEIGPFDRSETETFVRMHWAEAPAEWIDDFHHFSAGSPRVQQYALEFAGTQVTRAIDWLKPDIKNLERVFSEQLHQALKKSGDDREIEVFCSGVIALPRPIPIQALAILTELTEAQVKDICADLQPAISLRDGTIGLSDEDFEYFIIQSAGSRLLEIQNRAADYFLKNADSNGYAARHLAQALYAVGRGDDIINLVKKGEPRVIGDSVLRREVHLGRLKIAMKVCRNTGNTSEALLTLLLGAEALKTDAAIRKMLTENLDLASRFGGPTTSGLIFQDPESIQFHGPLLFHTMAKDAAAGNAVLVREGYRQFRGWSRRREEHAEAERKKYGHNYGHSWDIGIPAIAAEIEAILRTRGPKEAVRTLRSWGPKELLIAPQVALLLATQLIMAGEAELLETCLSSKAIRGPWQLFLLVPLVLAGRPIDTVALEKCISSLARKKLVKPDLLLAAYRSHEPITEYLEVILNACEILAARGMEKNENVLAILRLFSSPSLRLTSKLYTHSSSLLDQGMRAYALIESIEGKMPNVVGYLLDPPSQPVGTPEKDVLKSKQIDSEKRTDLTRFISSAFEVYAVGAALHTHQLASNKVIATLADLAGRFEKQEYNFSRTHGASELVFKVANYVARWIAVPSLDSELVWKTCVGILDPGSMTFGPAEMSVHTTLALREELQGKLSERLCKKAHDIRAMRDAADTKIYALTSIARSLALYDGINANQIFNNAIEVASEVDSNAFHEIELIEALVSRARPALTADRRRSILKNILIFVGDVGVRLEGDSNFPWHRVASAIAALDLPISLAATARFEDSDLADRSSLVPTIVQTGLENRDISAPQALGLLSFLSRFDIEVFDLICTRASEVIDLEVRKELVECLAQEELLRFGKGERRIAPVLGKLLPDNQAGPWLRKLDMAEEFFARKAPILKTERVREADYEIERRQKVSELFKTLTWPSALPPLPEDLLDFISSTIASTQAERFSLSAGEILVNLADSLSKLERIRYLEMLSKCRGGDVSDHELAKEILRCLSTWKGDAQITGWIKEGLPEVLVELLPGFARYISIGEAILPSLLSLMGLDEKSKCELLLEGLERNAEELDAPFLYAILEETSQFASPEIIADVLERFSARVAQRVLEHERDTWNFDDIPSDVPRGIAKFIYAMCGDIDVRIRWRAAHALRKLAAVQETEIVVATLRFNKTKALGDYRLPVAPFYWMAAKLWVLIALERIASEHPEALKKIGGELFDIATDKEFPHLLVRMFAKKCYSRLVVSGHIKSSALEKRRMKAVNTSSLKKRKQSKKINARFERHRIEQFNGQRYHFDSMDTLPYWYSNALECFANLSGEEFLKAAEIWIIDNWKVTGEVWRWDQEARRQRFEKDRWSGGHSHGSLPIMERYYTYLEWHAMWCAAGTLLETHPLRIAEKYERGGLDTWLDDHYLTYPPLWLTDIRAAKPCEDRFWSIPTKEKGQHLADIGDEDFILELKSVLRDEDLVVSSSHSTEINGIRYSARVRTALVSPGKAAALVRALQMVPNDWDYGLPYEDNDLEINSGSFRLKGWLSEESEREGIDRGDTFRSGVTQIQCRPTKKTLEAMGIKFDLETRICWKKGKHKQVILQYEAWSDRAFTDQRSEPGYDELVSSGWRLFANKVALREFLKLRDMDLLVKVELTRKVDANERSRRQSEEGETESTYDRIFCVRKDGSIERAEGPFGTWGTFSS